MKNSIYIYSEKPTNIFNECLINGKFPDTLKRADVIPIFEKGHDNEKKNYCPLSMLSTFSKLFEKLVFVQVNDIRKLNYQSILQVFAKITALKLFYWLWLKNRELF